MSGIEWWDCKSRFAWVAREERKGGRLAFVGLPMELMERWEGGDRGAW